SSRRRHTSFSRDWSSDVCSSDLRDRCYEGEKAFGRGVTLFQEHDKGDTGDLILGVLLMGQGVCCPKIGQATKGRALLQDSVRLRSEERRVGKECRSRWRRWT